MLSKVYVNFQKRGASVMAHLWLGFAVLLSGCANPNAVSVTRVRLGFFPNITHAPALIGLARGTFQQALGETKLEARTFNAGPSLIEALWADEIDIGYIGPSPAINGFVRSHGQSHRIIAGAASGGAYFVVRPQAGIGNVQDLAGKRLATPQKGGTQDVALRHYLLGHGLSSTDEGGTVDILPTQNPDILTLFKKGELDGAWVPEPWATRLIQEAGGQVFVDERTQWPNGRFVTTVVIVSSKFQLRHPDLVKRFLAAHVDAVEFIRDNPNDAKSLVNTEIEKLTTKSLPAAVSDTAFSHVDFTYDPLPDTLYTSADYAFELGFLGDNKPDLKGIFDLTLLNEVLKEKGSILVNP